MRKIEWKPEHIKAMGLNGCLSLNAKEETTVLIKKIMCRLAAISSQLDPKKATMCRRIRTIRESLMLTAPLLVCFGNIFMEETNSDEEESSKKMLEWATKFVSMFNMISEFTQSAKVHFDKSQMYPFVPMFLKYVITYRNWNKVDAKERVDKIKKAMDVVYAAKMYASSEAVMAGFDKTFANLKDKMVTRCGSRAAEKIFEDHMAELMKLPRLDSILNQKVLSGHVKKVIYTNEMLAHELSLCEQFQIPKSYDETDECYRESFWADLAVQVQNGDLTRLKAVLSETHEKMLLICEPNEMQDQFDVEFMKQRMDSGAMDIQAASVMLNGGYRLIMSKTTDFSQAIQAEMAAAWAKTHGSGVLNGLRTLMSLCDDISLAKANVALRLMVPLMKTDGVKYLHDKFQKKLDSGETSLQVTKNWIQCYYGGGGSVFQVFCAALAGIIRGSHELPETMILDEARIGDMRLEFDYLVDIYMARGMLVGEPAEVVRAISVQLSKMEPLEQLEAEDLVMLSDEKQKRLSDLLLVVDETPAVMVHAEEILEDLLQRRLAASPPVETFFAVPSSVGAPEHVRKLAARQELFIRGVHDMAKLHWQVYGHRYPELIMMAPAQYLQHF
jgi:hypothetical protein